MREETRKKLERTLWMRRVRWTGAGLCAVLALGSLFVFESLDASVENRSVHGVVARVAPLNGMTAKAIAQGLSVDVKLDDGRLVNVMALKTSRPAEGQDIQIAEHRHGTGGVSYSWK